MLELAVTAGNPELIRYMTDNFSDIDVASNPSSSTTNAPITFFQSPSAEGCDVYPEWMNDLPEPLKGYAKDCWNMKLNEICDEKFENANKENLILKPKCSIMFDWPKIPVLAGGHLYDLESLANNNWKNPLCQNHKFEFIEIQPIYAMREYLEQLKKAFPLTEQKADNKFTK